MPAPNAGPRKATVKCSECQSDVEVTLDKEENKYVGVCQCGWDVGGAYTAHRRNQSIASFNQPEPKKKRTSIFD